MVSSTPVQSLNPTACAIEYAAATVCFDGQIAVDALDLQVPVGQTTVLLGPSGCGKTTLLRLAIGLQQVDRGAITVLGQRLPNDRLNELRHSIGYVVQEGGLFPHLSSAENAAIVARHLGWNRERINARLSELSQLVRLRAELLTRFPGQLSGGERQRVGLMRALFLDPDLLLLDEPLAALDPIVKAQLQDDLKRIFEGFGKSVLLVTHDLAEAGYLGDQLVLLRAGKIVQRGSLRHLLEQPADPFVNTFVNAQRGLSELLARGDA